MTTLKKTKRGHISRPPLRGKAVNPLAHLPMARYVAMHCQRLEVLHYSLQTVSTRARLLQTFVVWANERSVIDPRDVTKPVIDSYQQFLYYYRKPDGKPLGIKSQMNLLHAVKMFFKWTTRENHTPYNPASEVEMPKAPRHLPRTILTVADVAAILNETDTTSLYGLRDRAMLELLYSTGLRRMELGNLTHNDIDFKRNVVFVREGKGRRDRVVPMGARACEWLEKYINEARPALVLAACDALFVTDFGDPVMGDYVTARVKRYMALAGIARPGAAHLLRHACATHMLENGADIRYIQALLGHTNLNTTQIYTHVSIDKLKAIHEATHPARLGRVAGAGEVAAQPEDENAASALLAALEAESSEEESGEQASPDEGTAANQPG